MTKNQKGRMFVFMIALCLSQTAYAQVMDIGEYDFRSQFFSPHPYPGSSDGALERVWSDRYHYPNANYVVFHFNRFEIAPGDFAIIRDPEGTVQHIYRDKGFLNMGSFFALSVAGDTALIEIYSQNKVVDAFGYEVDFVARGYSGEELIRIYGRSEIESVCGEVDWKDAICYEKPYATEYQKSRAAAKLLREGRTLCSTWLASCENHMLTNNHCFRTQADLDRIEVQFMYQTPGCGEGTARPELQLQGGEFLRTNSNYDYTLFIPNGAEQDPQGTYGFISIDLQPPSIGDRMYIVGHPRGLPKKISLESTHPQDTDGVCRVQTLSGSRCIGIVPNIGYYCDTDGGSSGSVVMSAVSHKAIALHHCGACPNLGVPIVDVYNDIQGSDTPLPLCATEE